MWGSVLHCLFIIHAASLIPFYHIVCSTKQNNSTDVTIDVCVCVSCCVFVQSRILIELPYTVCLPLTPSPRPSQAIAGVIFGGRTVLHIFMCFCTVLALCVLALLTLRCASLGEATHGRALRLHCGSCEVSQKSGFVLECGALLFRGDRLAMVCHYILALSPRDGDNTIVLCIDSCMYTL